MMLEKNERNDIVGGADEASGRGERKSWRNSRMGVAGLYSFLTGILKKISIVKENLNQQKKIQ